MLRALLRLHLLSPPIYHFVYLHALISPPSLSLVLPSSSDALLLRPSGPPFDFVAVLVPADALFPCSPSSASHVSRARRSPPAGVLRLPPLSVCARRSLSCSLSLGEVPALPCYQRLEVFGGMGHSVAIAGCEHGP